MECRKHGGSKRSNWRKIHIGIDEETLEIRATVITGSNIGDAPILPSLLDRIPAVAKISSATVDGAYDTRKDHEAIAARGAAAVIPPRKNAKPRKIKGPRCHRSQRSFARLKIPGPCHLATIERLPPPERDRVKDELHLGCSANP